MLLLLLGIVVIVTVLAFVGEVAGILAKTEYRPSVFLSFIARIAYDGFWRLTNFLGILADWIGGVRRLALWTRDTFFRFIPREVIVEADRNLRTSFKALLRSPTGLIWGFYDAIRVATTPWLSFTNLVLAFVIVPVLFEVLLLVYGFETRLSTCIAACAVMAYNFFWSIGHFPSHFASLSTLVMAIVESLIARWVPKKIISLATTDILKESWNLVIAARGFKDGTSAIGIDAASLFHEFAPFLGNLSVVATLSLIIHFALKSTAPVGHPAEVDGEESGDEDDDDDDEEEEEEEVDHENDTRITYSRRRREVGA